MAKQVLEWLNFKVEDMTPEIAKLHRAAEAAEALRNQAIEKQLKKKGIMPHDKYLRINVRGDNFGVAFADSPSGTSSRHISLK